MRTAWDEQPSLHRLRAQPPVWRRLVAYGSGLFRRAPSRRLIGAVIIMIALVSTVLYFRSGSASSPPSAKPVAAKQALPVTNAKAVLAEDFSVTWTALEPAYRNYKVQINNDSSLQTGNQAIDLYGIKVLPRGQICTYRNGERWACGQRAYIALVNVMGKTTIDCRPKNLNRQGTVICHLAGVDISELMLREGWANLDSGVTEARYIDAAAAAFQNKTGMWSLQPATRRVVN